MSKVKSFRNPQISQLAERLSGPETPLHGVNYEDGCDDRSVLKYQYFVLRKLVKRTFHLQNIEVNTRRNTNRITIETTCYQSLYMDGCKRTGFLKELAWFYAQLSSYSQQYYIKCVIVVLNRMKILCFKISRQAI